jgi:hypothetical protein
MGDHLIAKHVQQPKERTQMGTHIKVDLDAIFFDLKSLTPPCRVRTTCSMQKVIPETTEYDDGDANYISSDTDDNNTTMPSSFPPSDTISLTVPLS